MIIYSWNINGIRSAHSALINFLGSYSPDILFLQEVRAFDHQIKDILAHLGAKGYKYYFNYAEKPGYSGTAVCYKTCYDLKFQLGATYLRTGSTPLFGSFVPPVPPSEDHPTWSDLQAEGRLISFDFEDTHFINVYVPNGGSSEARLAYKLDYLSKLNDLLQTKLSTHKKLVIGGDLNVAHTPLDLYSPAFSGVSGFLPHERARISRLLDTGFVDAFRFYTKTGGNYSWWNLKDPTRVQNKGWRFDYFLVSHAKMNDVKSSPILSQVFGSDHCPIGLEW